MVMASGLYGITLRDILDASALPVDLITDTVKYALVTDTHTPDFNLHDAYADVTNEVTGTGYTAGGVTLASKTLVATAGVLTFDAADAQWTTATISSIRGAVCWDDTVATPTADPLVFAVTFGSDFSVTAGTLTVQFNASGLFTVDYVP